MTAWVSQATDHLWLSGLAAIPLVALAAILLKILPCRPSTRHLVWLSILVWPLVPPLLPGIQNPWPSAPQDVETPAEDSIDRPAVIAETPRATVPSPAAVPRTAPRHAALPTVGLPRSARVPQQPPAVNPLHNPVSGDAVFAGQHNWSAIDPSPRSGARPAPARPDMLAQPSGAVGLPPREETADFGKQNAESASAESNVRRRNEGRRQAEHRAQLHASSPGAFEFGASGRGEYCPLVSSPLEICLADSSPVVPSLRTTPPGRASLHGPREAAAIGLGNPIAAITVPHPGFSHPGDAIEIDGTPAPSEPIPAFRIPDFAFSETFRGWATVCLKVRDDLAQLPPLPFEVWAGGTLLLLLLAVLRVAAFRRLIRRAEPAPQDVLDMVADAAKKIGLSAPPQTSMVRRCMSPMVWCAVRPRLLLPRELWSDLDDIGRRAVVMHELAHLRRRDHWVLWADSIVGSLYWWHPLVWFVRRRMQMEAEYCCDAWVTSLLPKTRRAYAQALLKTRQFLGEGAQLGFVPAMGMGISSGRANRFARRLTMVMTKSSKPGASLWGVALVLLIATSGWLVSPARSCPEEEKAKAAASAAPCANAKPCAQSAPCAKSQADQELTAAKAAQEKTSYARYMAQRAMAPAIAETAAAEKALAEAVYAGHLAGTAQWKTVSGNEDEQKRIRELQLELERLGRQLETLNAQMHGAKAGKVAKRKDGRSDHAHEHEDDHAHGLFHAHPTPPAPPTPPRAPRPGQAAMPAMPAMPPMPPMPPAAVVAPRAHGGPHAMFAPAVPGQPTPRPRAFPQPGQTWADVEKGEMEWRTYKLSDGKRGPFTEFMSRSDVPVLVRANPEGIDIQATPPQHRVFRAFFQLIDPMEERADADFAPEAMGVGFAQAGGWLQAFGGCEGCQGCKCGKCDHAREARAHAERIREEARAMANDVRARAQGEGAKVRAEARARANEVRDRLRQESRRIRTEAENQEELIRSLEREAETLREHGERMRERSERVRERADRVRERAEENGDEDAANEALIEHMRELERNAAGLNAEAEGLNAKAEELMMQLETVRGGSSMLEGHADEVEHRADAIDELTDSIEGLEAGPELAMSIAELAAQIEHLATSGAAPVAEEWITALSMPEIPDGLTGEALEEALEAAAEALEEAVEEAAEAAAEEVEAELDSEDDSEDSDDDDDDDDDDDEESEDDEDSDDDDGGDDDDNGGAK